MKKSLLIKMGLLTLLVFPIPTFVVLYFVEGIYPLEIFDVDSASLFTVGLGIMFGFYYAIFVSILMASSLFQSIPDRLEPLIRNLNLTWYECLFLSICAGLGEELLFRSGIQFYLGPILTSLIFIAVHGYFNPKNWKKSLYGVVLLPFILLLSYGFYEYGLWFCIGAHFSYDLYLFLDISNAE